MHPSTWQWPGSGKPLEGVSQKLGLSSKEGSMKLYIQPLKAGNAVSACLTLWEWLSNYGVSRRWDRLHSFKMAPPRRFNDVETQESFHGVKWESVTQSQIHGIIKGPMCEHRQREVDRNINCQRDLLWVVRLQLIFHAVLCYCLYAAFIGF